MMNFEEGLSLPYLGHKTKIRLLENLITLSEILKKGKNKKSTSRNNCKYKYIDILKLASLPNWTKISLPGVYKAPD